MKINFIKNNLLNINYIKMEESESQSKSPNKIEENKGNIENEQDDEYIIDPSKPFIEFDPNTSKEFSKNICQIVRETKNEKIIQTGFFLRFLVDLERFYCLMTNDYVINDESIINNQIINIKYEEDKTLTIKLDRKNRYIKSFKDKDLDITVIEILNEDNISKKYF